MSRQIWDDAIQIATESGTAVANTTSETILHAAQNLLANYLNGDRAVLIYAAGKYSTTGTPTLTFRLRWGGVAGTLLAVSAAITAAAGVTAAGWHLWIRLQTLLSGAAGQLLAIGTVKLGSGTAPTVGSATGDPGESFMTAGGNTAPAAVTADLTAAADLTLTAQWSAASASNTIQLMQRDVRSLN